MTGKKITRAHHAFWGIVLAFGFVASAQAQNIGWEGEAGIFVTPSPIRRSPLKVDSGFLWLAITSWMEGELLLPLFVKQVVL